MEKAPSLSSSVDCEPSALPLGVPEVDTDRREEDDEDDDDEEEGVEVVEELSSVSLVGALGVELGSSETELETAGGPPPEVPLGLALEVLPPS